MKRSLKPVVQQPTNTLGQAWWGKQQHKSLISWESELVSSELSVSCGSCQPAVAAALTLVFVSPPNYHKLTSFTAHSSEQERRHQVFYSKGSFNFPHPALLFFPSFSHCSGSYIGGKKTNNNHKKTSPPPKKPQTKKIPYMLYIQNHGQLFFVSRDGPEGTVVHSALPSGHCLYLHCVFLPSPGSHSDCGVAVTGQV